MATLSGGLVRKCRCWVRGALVFGSSPLLTPSYLLLTGRTRTRVGFKAHRNHRRQSIRNQERGVLALQVRPGSPHPPKPCTYPTGAWGPWASSQESAAILPVSVSKKAHALQRPSLFPKPQLLRILRLLGSPGLPLGSLKNRILKQILHNERG